MKRTILLVFVFATLVAKAQYFGGNGNGYGIIAVSNINLSINDSLYNGGNGNGFMRITGLNVPLFIIDSLFNGGSGNGYDSAKILNASLSLNDSLYNGGNGNGFDSTKILNANLSVNDSLFNGGNGNGFTKDTLLNAPLFLLDSLYNGGSGKGEIVYTATSINLGICTDTLIWNGNTSTSWQDPNNWDCGTLPGISSFVIIPSGKARYPVVLSNTEIRKLEVRTGASVSVSANRRLTINGQ